LIQMHLDDAANPAAAASAGKLTISKCTAEVNTLLSILATHGHRSESDALAAMNAGLLQLALAVCASAKPPENWHQALDQLLARLDRLKMAEKEKLITGLLATVTHDEQIVAEEIELVRAVCAAIHTPIPVITAQAKSNS